MKKRLTNERGFTLVELLIAVAISALIIVGSLAFLAYTTSVANDNRDKTEASLEVQYVGFWICEDMMQAGNFTLAGNSSSGNFPLIIWRQDPDTKDNYWVQYDRELEDAKTGLYRIVRKAWVNDRYAERTETILGQHLTSATMFCRRPVGGVSSSVYAITGNVTANIYGKTATNTYEVQPRMYAPSSGPVCGG